MFTNKLKLALTLSVFAALPLGCATSMVTTPSSVTVGNPIPLLSTSTFGTGVIELKLGALAGFQIKTEIAKVAADVLFYEIQLIDVTADGTPSDLNDNATVGPTYLMAGDQANSAQMNPAITADANKAMRFTQVPNGTYKARVKAMHDANPSVDSDVNPEAAGQFSGANTVNQNVMNVTKNDAANSNGPGQSNMAQAIAVSAGSASITTGGGAGSLAVTVNLADGKNDDIDVNLTVNSGFSAPATNASDI